MERDQKLETQFFLTDTVQSSSYMRVFFPFSFHTTQHKPPLFLIAEVHEFHRIKESFLFNSHLLFVLFEVRYFLLLK